MKRCIVNVSVGQRYQQLIPRLLQSLADVQDNVPAMIWRNWYPVGTPGGELPYAAYEAKPFAMRAARDAGFDLALWLDSASYAIAHTGPLWEHIEREGYFVQANGWNVGQWCSDAALIPLGISRGQSFDIPDIATGCLGLDLRRDDCSKFLGAWEMHARIGTFRGAHRNDAAVQAGADHGGRGDVSHLSDDPRVLGHRHDQTAASVIVHRLGWKRTERPIFYDYWREKPDDRTCLVNRG